MGVYNPTEDDRVTVTLLAGYGVPQKAIAQILGISEDTLRRHHREEFDLGKINANLAVSKNLFQMATGSGREALTAAIFWLKSQAGWREAPQEIEVRDVSEERTEDERARAMALMFAKKAANGK